MLNTKIEPDSHLILGDALAVLTELQRQRRQFDIVIADPPYNIGKDFGNNNDAMALPEYIKWTTEWVAKCFELLSPSGLLYLYGFPEIVAHISVNYNLNEQKWLVWHYTNKVVPRLPFWQRSHETILCLWKPGEKRPPLEVDQIRELYTENYLKCAGKKRKDTPSRYGRPGRITIYNAHENGALPRDVIKIPALAGGAGGVERWFICNTCDQQIHPPKELKKHRTCDILKHPTQKPQELTRRLLQSKINGKGGNVLIPFAGSGSECVTAQQLGINFVGIELNPDYVDLATKWLNYTRQGTL